MTYPIVPLSEVLHLHDAGVWGPEDETSGISVLRSTNFNADGSISFERLAFRDIEPKAREAKCLQPMDILLEKSGGGPKQPVGRVCLFAGHRIPHVFGNFIARLRTREEVALPEYVFWFLRRLYLGGGTEQYQKHTSGIRNLETKRFLKHPIPLPPIEEQRRIVDILNRAASIERLRRQASAHLRDFIPALFVKMFGDPIENPMGWPTVQLREIVSEFRYGTSKKSHDEAVEGASPILRIPNVIGGAVNLEDLKYTVLDAKEQSRLTLQRGDLLFVRTNGNPEYIGRCAVFDLSLDAAYASYLIRARVQETAPVSPFVIGDLLSLPSMRKVLLTLATTTAGNYNINIESLGSIVVPVPPMDAQDRYLSLAKAAKSRMSLASDSSVLAGNLSKSLLDRLLGADRS